MVGHEEEEQNKESRLDMDVFKSNLASTVELVDMVFLEPGSPIGLGELCEVRSMDMTFDQADEADAWVVAKKEEKESFLRNVIIEFGLVPEQLTGERA
jgi:hypothetical protein